MSRGSNERLKTLLFGRVWPLPCVFYAFAFVLSHSQDLEQNSETARVLSDALPFIQAHADRTVVIKYGGHAMENEEASLSFAQDVVMLKQVQYLLHNGCLDICTTCHDDV